MQTGLLGLGFDGLGCHRKQVRADTGALLRAMDVDVLEQRSPDRISCEDEVGKSDQLTAGLGDERAASWVGSSQPVGPEDQAICGELAVEEVMAVGTAVVTAPTRSMKPGDRAGVAWAGEAKIPTIGAGLNH